MTMRPGPGGPGRLFVHDDRGVLRCVSTASQSRLNPETWDALSAVATLDFRYSDNGVEGGDGGATAAKAFSVIFTLELRTSPTSPYDIFAASVMRGTDEEVAGVENGCMTQALDTPISRDTPALEKRVEELESVLRTVLRQINTHQVYDRDARGLIKRVLVASPTRETPAAAEPPARRQGEFPSLFPTASPPNFI